MFCPNCGNSLDSNASSCNRCGQSVMQKNDTINYSMNQSKNIKKSFPKGTLVLILLILVGLTGAFFGISYFLKGKNSAQKEVVAYFDSNKPIRIKVNELYGYIDSNGKTITNPIYKDASQFYENYAIVKLPKDENGNEYYALIDKKGKVVFTTTTSYIGSIEYISEYEIWVIQDKIYDKNLKLKTPETTSVDYIDNGYFEFTDDATKEAGIMTSTGKKTYTVPTNGSYLYLSVSISDKNYPDITEDYCSVNIDNEKYGIVNCKTGKIVYPLSEKYIDEEYDNIFRILDKNTYNVIETIYIEGDKIAYTDSSNGRLRYIGNHILEIRDENYKYTYYDVVNKKLLDSNPGSIDIADAWELLTSFDRVMCDEGGYAIKKGDEIIVPCGWDNISFINNPLYSYAEQKGKQLLFVKKDNKMSLYDIKTNKVVVNFNTSYISGNYGDSVFVYYKDADTQKTVVYNLINGKQQEFDDGVVISNYSNYFTVKKDNNLEYYNTDFKLIYTGSVS